MKLEKKEGWLSSWTNSAETWSPKNVWRQQDSVVNISRKEIVQNLIIMSDTELQSLENATRTQIYNQWVWKMSVDHVLLHSEYQKLKSRPMPKTNKAKKKRIAELNDLSLRVANSSQILETNELMFLKTKIRNIVLAQRIKNWELDISDIQ